MKISVEKMSKNNNTFRTPLDAIDGMPFTPMVGGRLILTSSTHESKGILTSPVIDVKVIPDGYEVSTEFSTYIIKMRKEH